MHFNSTMVRLKVGGGFLINLKAYEFQFHYGSVKRIEGEIGCGKECDFNSTMVRLKDEKTSSKVGNYNISIPLWFG